MSDYDLSFDCMGCRFRLLVGPPVKERLPPASQAAQNARAYLEGFDRRLSRFKADSELSRLNGDPHPVVPASVLLRTAVQAGLWAAEQSGGLIDPTLVPALHRVGYAQSRAQEPSGSLDRAVAQAPPRRPARPHPDAVWRQVVVDEAAGTIRRPPGVSLDSGGTGKGLAADAVAVLLAGYSRFVVDAAGDLRVGGPFASVRPYEVEIEHPLWDSPLGTVPAKGGGIATSGVGSRLWSRSDGTFGHHLLDPSTGQPVWSGLLSATALAATALEAETLAKWAVLAGPVGARVLLREHGGVLVHDDGSVEWIHADGIERTAA